MEARMVTSVSLCEQETGWSSSTLAWMSKPPKKRVNTSLLYRERNDPVKDGLANWRTLSGPRGIGIYLFLPPIYSHLSERSQMRSGFFQKHMSFCSRLRAMFHV